MPNDNSPLARSDSAPQLPAVAPPADGVLPPPIKLSQSQTTALEAIMAGKCTAEILKAAGVDRTTLWRWRTFDANFIAALNRWRHDVQIRVRDRVAIVMENAAEVVQAAVGEQNGRLALAILDKSGHLKPGATLPLDPYAIFGAGIDDENGRRAAYAGFEKARNTLYAEQAGRVVQIFALGIVADNQRRGYETAEFIREMAKDPEGPKSDIPGSLSTKTGSRLSDIAPTDPRRTPTRTKSMTRVTARVMKCAPRAGTFNC